MTKEQPQVSATGKYELREAAQALDVSTSTLTKWAAAGKINYGIKKINGRRFFFGSEIIRAWRATI